MPSQPSSSQNKAKYALKPSRVSTLRIESMGPPVKKQKLKPLSALMMPPAPVYEPVNNQTSAKSLLQSQGSKKGKEKATEVTVLDSDEEKDAKLEPKLDDRLWIDMYEPKTEAELAVHVRKVRDVRHWITEAFESDKLRKYRRILALTGPAGTAKTATIRVLSREMGFDVLEWRNSMDEVYTQSDDFDPDYDTEYEGLSEKFHKFLTRAIQCPPLFSPQSVSAASTSHSPTTKFAKSRKQVILLEDLPNVLHPGTQRSFHASLESLVSSSPSANNIPIIVILSSAGVRGENPEDDGGRSWRAKDSVDIRMVIPSTLWGGPYVTHISFNPIAPTLMRRGLQSLLTTYFASQESKTSSKPKSKAPAGPVAKEILDLVIETSNGDIRSAVMALQFACTSPSLASSSLSKKGARKGGNTRALLEAVTRREQSLALFHLIGKILYNKRKGDTPPASMSKADVERERTLDRTLKDPPPLPNHLCEHERKASRVDVEMLYADTPIDSSLLSLYIHQNYTQYCSTLDECASVAEWLSIVDASGGESIVNTNPTRFHLIALGTMHSLPTPVPRKGQRNYKPEFFDFLRKQREAEESVSGTLGWLRQTETWTGGWTTRDVSLELPSLLKAIDLRQSWSPRPTKDIPPAYHKSFSSLHFVGNSGSAAQVADEEFDSAAPAEESEEGARSPKDVEDALEGVKKSVAGGWLEEDDIEDI